MTELDKLMGRLEKATGPSGSPDETEGRALYRAHANTYARALINQVRRRVRIAAFQDHKDKQP